MIQPDDWIEGAYTRDDGFGTRYVREEDGIGEVEVLELAPQLATPAAEAAIRSRAAQLEGFGAPLIAPIHRVDRDEGILSVVAAAPDGVPLCELLAALEFGTLSLPDEAILELAAITVRAAGAMHEKLGPLAHGALNAAHIVLRRDGAIVVTDSVFGDALQQLDLNREELWRTFSLAMPPAATTPRFDRRSDVTQLGSVVLAVLMRRTLLNHEYPRPVADLVVTATAETGVARAHGPRLRNWLQQTLQLQPRTIFPSAVEAAHAFFDALGTSAAARPGAPVLQAAIRRMCGEVVEPAAAAPAPRPAAAPVEVPEPAEEPAPAPTKGFSFLRSVLPHLRAN